jgi:malto-oligosyltrehalose trehalohydrolase
MSQKQNVFQFGPVRLGDRTRFSIWAPRCDEVSLILDDGAPRPMTAADGWHTCNVDGLALGSRYRFRLPDGLLVPDPASRYQPLDVHGPSELVDARYDWTTQWNGRPWEEAVIYELHVGTFTEEGTFRAAMERLAYLEQLGVTAVELMPIADFPGRCNWGYDGVLPFAPDAAYGRPDDLKRLLDAAHRHGIMVLLDVVYNHFGPDGNYLPCYCPVFNEAHKTAWGASVNFDGPHSEVIRDFVTQNVLYWLNEFRFDGLRFDAVHAIKDDSGTHILSEIADRVRRELSASRHVHLILENEENEASRLAPANSSMTTAFTAQWNDDLHHVLHCAVTGEASGYYRDYIGDPVKLGRALTEGFAFQGEVMPYRGSPRGEPSAHLEPTCFVAFIQNHDQIGNRAFGERLHAIASAEAMKAAAAIYLLTPQIPMLFMGEEFASSSPFLFFCDFPEQLGKLVREGRRSEFAKFPEFQDAALREKIPDPTDETTFAQSKLRWDDCSTAIGQRSLALYRTLLEIRHREIVPRLRGMQGHSGQFAIDNGVVSARWTMGDGAVLSIVANLSPSGIAAAGNGQGRRLFTTHDVSETLAPWQVICSLESAGRP